MPISAPDNPSRIAALPNDAVAEQIRMSDARHNAKPAPTHGPLTAAIDGRRQRAEGLGQGGHPLLKPHSFQCGCGGLEHAGSEVTYIDSGAKAPPGAREDDGARRVVVG